ncbi:hypothetical protein [Pseudoalteromonas sp. S2755]|uniref:hypothetical protein n=1 Tax=Pseudoalteromonas sp. S2755 TaxID=2066523 RepID=UPI00110B9123|nr:hypothetical protein [Pseudoalteromonas sp. S2755]TMN45776.1 hypothetical protein CWC03_01425 [Pseudoalteromonas sp. S2755]
MSNADKSQCKGKSAPFQLDSKFRINGFSKKPLVNTTHTIDLKEKTLSHVLFSNLAYQEQIYRLKE